MPRARDRGGRIGVASWLLLKDLLRRRVTLLLLFIVPALFDAIVLVTTQRRDVEVTIAALVEEGAEIVVPGTPVDPYDLALVDNGLRAVDARALSLVFLGNTAVCFMTAFFAFYLVHRRREVDARLVLAGYRSWEVIAAKIAVLLVLVLALALYETAIIHPFFAPRHLERVIAGFFLGGLVYGGAGLLLGTLAGRELEGILLLILLANVDVGWLQNPVYYATSEHRSLIEGLPGYFPTQLALAGAFVDRVPPGIVGKALAYAMAVLGGSVVAFGLRIRPARPHASDASRIRRHYLRVCLVAYVVWIVAFQVVGRCAATLETIDLTTSLDRAIPLVSGFVWAYELCYVVPLLVPFVLRDWHRFNIALVAMVLANLTAFAVYLLLPVAFARPELGRGVSDRLLALEYAADFSPGANKLPSMHVAMTWIAACAIWRDTRWRVVDAAAIVVAVLITVSTVFVKQHVVLDTVAGVAWGLGAWWIARRLYGRFVRPGEDAEDALARLLVSWPWRWRWRGGPRRG